jgi:hypothetical protein
MQIRRSNLDLQKIEVIVMQVSKDGLATLQKLLEEVLQKKFTLEEAADIANRLLILMDIFVNNLKK